MHFLSVSVDETLFGQTYNINLPEAKMVGIVATFSPIGRIIDAMLKSIWNEKIKLSLQNVHGPTDCFPQKSPRVRNLLWDKTNLLITESVK